MSVAVAYHHCNTQQAPAPCNRRVILLCVCVIREVEGYGERKEIYIWCIFLLLFFWTYRCICCCSIRVLWVKPIFENWTVVMPHHCKVRVAVCETNVYVCVGCRYKIVRIKNKEMVGQRRSAGFGAARLQQQSKGPHDAAVKAGSSRYPSIGWALTQTCWSTPARQKSTRTELVRVRTSTVEFYENTYEKGHFQHFSKMGKKPVRSYNNSMGAIRYCSLIDSGN